MKVVVAGLAVVVVIVASCFDDSKVCNLSGLRNGIHIQLQVWKRPSSTKLQKKDSSHAGGLNPICHNHGSGNGAVFQKATTSRVIFCHFHDYGRVISIILTQSPMEVILVLKFLDAAPKWGSSSKIAAGNSPAKTKDMTLEQETKYSSIAKHTRPYLYSHIIYI